MCTTHPRISAAFADSSIALCRCTLIFCSLFQFPLGKQSFQYVSGETHTYTLSHQGRTSYTGCVYVEFAIMQCRLGCTESVLGNTCGRCQAGLEILVDLPMCSLVGHQGENKKSKYLDEETLIHGSNPILISSTSLGKM